MPKTSPSIHTLIKLPHPLERSLRTVPMYEDPLVEAVRPDGAIKVAQSAARGWAPLAELSILA